MLKFPFIALILDSSYSSSMNFDFCSMLKLNYRNFCVSLRNATLLTGLDTLHFGEFSDFIRLSSCLIYCNFCCNSYYLVFRSFILHVSSSHLKNENDLFSLHYYHQTSPSIYVSLKIL